MSNESRNSIHYRGEYHTKRTHLSEKNTINECVEKNTDSLCCSAEEETSASKNKWDWFDSSDSDSN